MAKIYNLLKYIILIFWALTTIFPLYWVFMNSFKPTSEILLKPLSLPKELNLNNYFKLSNYGNINFLKGFLNSMLISFSTTFIVIFLGSIASYALARFNYKRINLINSFFIGAQLVPAFSVIIPAIIIFKFLKLSGSYISLIILQAASFLPFAIITITSFMKSIPMELEEAAYIDGASVLKTFFKVILPISTPALITAGIFVFLWSYNDLFMSLILLPIREKQPICVLLSLVSSA
ncbi:MAG: carbohydrate ABC transporter permease, partial [Dictyoglomus sp.]